MIRLNSPPTNATAPDMATAPVVLKIPEFAARYGVGLRTVYKWLSIGLPHLKPSRTITRIPVKEADEWVHQKYFRQRER